MAKNKIFSFIRQIPEKEDLLTALKKSLSLQENNLGMAITSDRLRQTFSEGGTLEVSYYKPAVKGLRAKILSGKYKYK